MRAWSSCSSSRRPRRYPVEEQVVAIWTGTTGQLDDIAVEDVRRFESEFLDYLRRERSGLLDAIRETKKLADETRSGLEDAVEAFKAQFGAGGKENVPVGHEPSPTPSGRGRRAGADRQAAALTRLPGAHGRP